MYNRLLTGCKRKVKSTCNVDESNMKITLWMIQSDMASLFQCSTDNFSLHLKNTQDEGELDPRATAEGFSVVRQECTRQVKRKVTCCSLDAVISVGYRVKSVVTTIFRMEVRTKPRFFTGLEEVHILKRKIDETRRVFHQILEKHCPCRSELGCLSSSTCRYPLVIFFTILNEFRQCKISPRNDV